VATDPLAEVYQEAGRAWNVDPDLLRAVAKGESGRQGSAATSEVGAIGRMQLMPDTARSLGVTNPRDDVQSIFGGAKLLASHLDDAKDDVPTALRTYFAGPDRSKWGPKTAAYPAYILSHYRKTDASPDAAAAAPDDAELPVPPIPPDTVPPPPGAPATMATSPRSAAKTTAAAHDGMSDEELLQALTGGAPAPAASAAPAAAPAAPQAGMSDDDLLKALTSGADAPAVPAAKVMPSGDRYGPIAGEAVQQNLLAARAADSKLTADDRVKNALAPAPDTTYGSVLPFARDDKTGEVRMALPSGLREMLTGGYDLSQGPATGTVTPGATNALAGVMMSGGLTPSPAVGTSAAVASSAAAAANEKVLSALPPELRVALHDAVGAPVPQNLLSGQAVPPVAVVPGNALAGAAKAEAPITSPVPGVEAPANPLSFPSLKPADPANRLAGAAPEPSPGMGGPSSPAAPSAGMGGSAASSAAPAPNSVGAAATPTNMTPMGSREAAASQATGENYRLFNPRAPGVDKTEYIPGVKPTAAEVAGDSDLAARQKFVAQTPGQKNNFDSLQAANNQARVDYYETLEGTPTIVNSMKEARNAQAAQDLQAAWGKKTEADPSSVVQQIDQVLAGPSGKESAVSTALTKIRGLLYDAKGNLETDPEILYGARKEVAAMLGKAAQQEKPTLRDAANQIGVVKDALDNAIELGAPGYGKYLENYSAASRPIDTMELLQDRKLGLVNKDGNITFNAANKMMKDIVTARQAPGANPAKSIDDETMDALWNMHADLHRLNASQTAAKAQGSDTSMLGRIGGGLASTVAHGAANYVAPGVGSLIAKSGLDAVRGRMSDRAANKLAGKLLDGMNYGGPPQVNPLSGARVP